MEDYLYPFLKLYKSLPTKAQQFVGMLYTLLPARRKYGDFYQEYSSRISAYQHGDFDARALLESTKKYAAENIPFYKNKDASQELSQFGIIDKDIISSQKELFVNSKLSNFFLQSNTGGTSGNPFAFYLHRGMSRSKEKAHFDWYWGQFSYERGDRVLMLRGAPLKDNKLFEYQAIDNKLAASCYQLNSGNIESLMKAIKNFRPKFIHAYPSSLKTFTLLMQNKNYEAPPLQAIFLGSEYLSSQDRKLFEAYYTARVVNWYGHSELLVHAGNCQFSNDYHIYPFYGHVELITEGNNINQPGKVGKIIGTGFDNQVMPLIRYDTGDLAEYSNSGQCKCGFKGYSFGKIHGREQNYIVLNDKTEVSVTAFIFGQHFEEFNKMREIQLVQDREGYLLVRIVPNELFSIENIKQLKEKMARSVSHKIDVSIELVESTEKTLMGKHRILLQNINNH